MKTLRISATCCVLAIVLLLFSCPAKAQAPVSYRPGEVIRISITFDGPDADKIRYANMSVSLTSKQDPDQSNFENSFRGNSKLTGPKTFEVYYTVSDTLADGEYKLSMLTAILVIGQTSGQVAFNYGPSDFPSITFKIDNPTKVKKPTIKSVTELPKS
jgi:hypothetical protein